jgi:hypothetical protein
MTLTTGENESATLSKARHRVCIEAAWEIEALAYLLPTVTLNSDEEATRSGFLVRGIASRLVGLANALMAGLHDDAVTVEELEREVMVNQL